MHGCNSGSALLVNAEVDSMGGVVDGGGGVGVKTSPRKASIEKAQAELRQEYDVREERRKELEFLEKGGNPLDFKFGSAASVSVQSTSLTDQQAEHFVTSEAKGSFARTASPHGDSVESSGRPGVPVACEPHTADNLLLFDGENELHEGKRNYLQRNKKSVVAPLEQSSSRMDGTKIVKESEDSAIFRPYARRNRSKVNRDNGRSNSADMVQSRTGHGSLPARGGLKDMKGSITETNSQKERNSLWVANPKSTASNGDLVPKKSSDKQSQAEPDNIQAAEVINRMLKGPQPERILDATASKILPDRQQKEVMQAEAPKSFTNLAFDGPYNAEGKEEISASLERPSGVTATKDEKETTPGHVIGISDSQRDKKLIPNAGQQNSNTSVGSKRLGSGTLCTRNNPNVDVENNNDTCITKNVDHNGRLVNQSSVLEGKKNAPDGDMVHKKDEIKLADDNATITETNAISSPEFSFSDPVVKIDCHRSDTQKGIVSHSNSEGLQQNDHIVSEADKEVSNASRDYLDSKRAGCPAGTPQGMVDISITELSKNTLLGVNDVAAMDPQGGSDKHIKLMDKAREDSILEEARIIEAKRKRIAELSIGILPLEHRRKSQWDFVLEEMAWLANDFAQERLWKMTAAAQTCRHVALTSRVRFEEQNQYWKLKKVAFSLANGVLQFWHSALLLLNSGEATADLKNNGLVGSGDAANEVSGDKTGEYMDTSNEFNKKPSREKILGYALRFLKYNSSLVPSAPAEVPTTPIRISDSGITEASWDEHLTEESLFYAVPLGSMEAYRKSIEPYLLQTEKASSMQEEVETSAYDVGAEFGFHELRYDEDGETSAYYLHRSFEGHKPSKANQKRRKHPMTSYTTRPNDMGADMPYRSCAIGSQQSMLLGKKPDTSLNAGSIPTKRVRTNARNTRVISPFDGTPTSGVQETPAKTDASSGDTNSFQDDQSTLHGGSHYQKSMEVESTGDYEMQLPYESAETATIPKKKKRPKHIGSGFDRGWQLESTGYNEQRDQSRKRSDYFDSNGTGGLYGQHNLKRQKIMKPHLDGTFDINPTGSIPSPVASQVSNMSNSNKFIKFIGGRDRGRKPKGSKMSVGGHSGSTSPWSLFEDQALVVLVHDMGPNWELVSDAINSTLQFKCIFRKPKECKERHKILMDRSGDGADSADDSGSSHSYPSTLPGIPKGSARQLFQRLQGPMEEDTLKTHFEKIITIGKKHYRRIQNDNQETKQMVQVHSSHYIALSQVCQNNQNGVLTPLDLCDVTPLGQDLLTTGYQPAQSSNLGVSNKGGLGSIFPASGANSPIQSSSAVVLGNNASSPPTPLNTSVRDGRHSAPRTSLPVDEQQRMQQYNHFLSSRNIQQSNMSVPGAVSGGERGVRMLPGGNISGTNRSMPATRPALQGMTSSSMLNCGSTLSANVGMPNVHAGPGLTQGNSILRPRDSVMMRPGHNPEHQRQLMAPELQMQATQGTSQGIPAFGGLSSGFSNQTIGHPPQQQHQMPSQQSHTLSSSHLQGSNTTGAQQQAYAIRLAKERQMHQQRLVQQHQQPPSQQQPQFSSSGALMPHIQPQPQLPIASLQNSSPIQLQASNQHVSLPSLTSSSMTPIALSHQQKHHMSPHGLSRIPQSGASGLTNQMVKQRQRQSQQFQQSGRNHPQQRQQTQSQQQGKPLKGTGRGNMLVHHAVDPSHLNGLSMPPSNQIVDKGEQMMHLDPGLYSASGISPVQQSKPLVSSQSSNHPQPQPKFFAGAAPPSKQLQQMPPHSGNSTQGQVLTSSSHQTVLPAVMPSSHQHFHLPSQSNQKQGNQSQSTVKRVLQHGRPMHPDPPNKAQAEPQNDQLPMKALSSTSTPETSVAPQASIDSTNEELVESSAVASQRKGIESGHDFGIPDTAATGTHGSSPHTDSAGNGAVASVSQELGQRQLSCSLPPKGYSVGEQWQPQSQLQPLPTPQLSQDQVLQDQDQSSQQKLPPQQQTQQQTQHLQAAQGSLYPEPSSSKME